MQSQSLDVTAYVHEGTNLIRCIQLRGLQSIFILHASERYPRSQHRDALIRLDRFLAPRVSAERTHEDARSLLFHFATTLQ